MTEAAVTRSALWGREIIDYLPGRLVLAIRPGYNRAAYEAIHSAGGQVVFITPTGICEVVVPDKHTLQAAAELVTTGVFRFVEPARNTHGGGVFHECRTGCGQGPAHWTEDQPADHRSAGAVDAG
jgi:hypothetical protein